MSAVSALHKEGGKYTKTKARQSRKRLDNPIFSQLVVVFVFAEKTDEEEQHILHVEHSQ